MNKRNDKWLNNLLIGKLIKTYKISKLMNLPVSYAISIL